MYHVSAQGVDELMINVHYYYYYYKKTLEGTERLLAVAAFNRGIFGEAYSADNASAGRHAMYSTAKDQSFLLLCTFDQEAVRAACILVLSGLT